MKSIGTTTFIVLIVLAIFLLAAGSFLITKGLSFGLAFLDQLVEIIKKLIPSIFPPSQREPNLIERAILCAYALCNYGCNDNKFSELGFADLDLGNGRICADFCRYSNRNDKRLCGDDFRRHPIDIDLSSAPREERNISKEVLESFAKETPEFFVANYTSFNVPECYDTTTKTTEECVAIEKFHNRGDAAIVNSSDLDSTISFKCNCLVETLLPPDCIYPEEYPVEIDCFLGGVLKKDEYYIWNIASYSDTYDFIRVKRRWHIYRPR